MKPGEARSALYMTGSTGDDVVTATYASGVVTFTTGPSSEGDFDAVAAIEGGCQAPTGSSVVCAIEGAPDSIVLAGLEGDDTLEAPGFPETTSIVLLGGEDGDWLTGGTTEDALVDGPGDDIGRAAGGDDALPNNSGDDELHAGSGEDLFISDAVCDGDTLDGGPDRDNANWANFSKAVTIDMAIGRAGMIAPSGEAQCPSENLLTKLIELEDIEGTGAGDIMIGDSGPNQLLGRQGPDRYYAGGGNDSILANSGTPNPDPDPTIDCGDGWDTALRSTIRRTDRMRYRLAARRYKSAIPTASARRRRRLTQTPMETPKTKRRPHRRRRPGPRPHAAANRHRPPSAAPRLHCAPLPPRRLRLPFQRARSALSLQARPRRFRPCGSRRVYRLRPGRHALARLCDRPGRQPRPLTRRVQVRRRRVSVHWSRSHRRRGQTR